MEGRVSASSAAGGKEKVFSPAGEERKSHHSW